MTVTEPAATPTPDRAASTGIVKAHKPIPSAGLRHLPESHRGAALIGWNQPTTIRHLLAPLMRRRQPAQKQAHRQRRPVRFAEGRQVAATAATSARQ